MYILLTPLRVNPELLSHKQYALTIYNTYSALRDIELFSIVNIELDTFTHSVGRLQFLHILDNAFCFLSLMAVTLMSMEWYPVVTSTCSLLEPEMGLLITSASPLEA